MDESFVCECSNDEFWFFGWYVRCKKCFNEYQHFEKSIIGRRFNLESKLYSNHWEKFKSFKENNQ